MHRTIARLFAVLVLGSASMAWTQEEPAEARKIPSKAAREARAREAQRRTKARAKAEKEARAKAVSVSRATREELMKLPGVTAAYADAIIAKRPYKSKADLVEKGAIPEGLFLALRKQITVK